jgi:hypothetical protein
LSSSLDKLWSIWRRAIVAISLLAGPSAATESSLPSTVNDDRNLKLFDFLVAFEAKVDTAIRDKDVATLAALAEVLGAVVDQSIELKEAGREATECDFAVQGLHFFALTASSSSDFGDLAAELTRGVIRDGLPDYMSNMAACAIRVRREPGVRPTFEFDS